MEDGPGRDDLAADAELLVGERREEAEQLDDVQVVRVLAEDELQHRKEERDGERLEDLPASTRRRQGRWTLGDERGDPVGRLADGGVRGQFIGGRLVVQQLCDCPVARGDGRDNTQVDVELQSLPVDVVRFAEVVVVHLPHDGSRVVKVLSNVVVVQPDQAKV